MTLINPAIERGMALLSEHFSNGDEPPWHDRIDLTRLDLANAHDCVLGQLFPTHSRYGDGYDTGRRKLGIWDQPAYYGFDAHTGTFAELTDQWRAAIRARRETAA